MTLHFINFSLSSFSLVMVLFHFHAIYDSFLYYQKQNVSSLNNKMIVTCKCKSIIDDNVAHNKRKLFNSIFDVFSIKIDVSISYISISGIMNLINISLVEIGQ